MIYLSLLLWQYFDRIHAD